MTAKYVGRAGPVATTVEVRNAPTLLTRSLSHGFRTLFTPRRTFYGAVLLACTVGFATVLSLTRLLPDSPAAPLALTLLAATVAWLTRPRDVSEGAVAGLRS